MNDAEVWTGMSSAEEEMLAADSGMKSGVLLCNHRREGCTGGDVVKWFLRHSTHDSQYILNTLYCTTVRRYIGPFITGIT